MAMKVGIVELRVSVRMEVPEHVVERDLQEQTMNDVMHDYAVGCINRDVEARHGESDEDWISLTAEVVFCEVEEKLYTKE